LTLEVPAPDKYPTDKIVNEKNWKKPPTAIFNKGKVNSFVDQIIHFSASKEKCTPGSPAYVNDKAFRYTKGKVWGGNKTTDDRTHWIDENTHIANWTPGFKFKDVDVARYKHPNINNISKIYTHSTVRETNEKERMGAHPAPTSYKVMESFNSTSPRSPRGSWGKLSDKRIPFTQTAAKKSISPGPA